MSARTTLKDVLDVLELARQEVLMSDARTVTSTMQIGIPALRLPNGLIPDEVQLLEVAAPRRSNDSGSTLDGVMYASCLPLLGKIKFFTETLRDESGVKLVIVGGNHLDTPAGAGSIGLALVNHLVKRDVARAGVG